MSTSEVARFVGFRLYEKHRIIIRKLAKKWKCSESEVIRKLIENVV